MISQTARRWMMAFGCCCILVFLCVVFVDHPVADDSRIIFGGTDLFQWVVKIFRPMELAAAAAFLLIAASAIRTRSQKRKTDKMLLSVQCGAAGAIALLIALVMKIAV